MKKYNIKINRPELVQSEIENGMDFSKLKSNSTTKSKWLSTKIVAGFVVVSIAILAVIWFGNKIGNSESAEQAKLPTNINVADTFIVNAEKDTTLLYKSGSRIKIPANAFVDENGKEIKGNVKVKYREFHNVGEILLADIPMTYDSAGKQMYFESAGMFDVGASQNGNPVFIKQNKSLDISLATLDTTKDKFNKYLLDTKTNKWQFIDKDEPYLYPKPLIQTAIKYGKGIDTFQVRRAVKPLKSRLFTVDAEGRPDLEIYNNVVFEITEDCKTFNPDESKTEWYLVEFEKIKETDKYKVTFSFPHTGIMRTYEVIARPLKDKNMDNAIKKYDIAYQKWQQKLTDSERKYDDSLIKENEKFKDVFQKYLALQNMNEALYNKQVAKAGEASQVVYRTFQIKQFGIWNSDCPQSMPQGIEVLANFETTNGAKINISAVYLIEKGKNAMYNLYVPKKLSFNPDAENILLVITSKGKLGWIKNDVFQSIGKTTKNFIFKLNILDKETYTSTDINSLLI